MFSVITDFFIHISHLLAGYSGSHPCSMETNSLLNVWMDLSAKLSL